jgi:hypothetical protein
MLVYIPTFEHPQKYMTNMKWQWISIPMTTSSWHADDVACYSIKNSRGHASNRCNAREIYLLAPSSPIRDTGHKVVGSGVSLF